MPLKSLLLILTAWMLVAPARAADIAFVAGGTGGTGRFIVSELVSRGIPVRALSRDPANTPKQPGVTWVAGDVTKPETLGPAMAGATYVISAIGARESTGPNSFEFVDWGGNRNLIDAAKAAGAKQMIIITSGTAGEGTWTDPRLARLGASRMWKAKAEAHLRASGVPYTIVAPGGLRDYPGNQQGVKLAPRNAYAIGIVSRADVAAVAVTCLGNPDCLQKTMTVVNDQASAPGLWRKSLVDLPIDTPETIRGGTPVPN